MLRPCLKYILAFITCFAWCPFYEFLNSCIRTCNLCCDTISSAKNFCFKILACIFFLVCFSFIELLFCFCGLIYLFQGPCQAFANSNDLRKGYIALVAGDHFPIEASIRGSIFKCFCK